MTVIKNEMLRAMQITDKIVSNPGSSWVELFDKVDFFGQYRIYVQVIAAASTAEGIKDWSGMVESRIRTLVQDLEMTDTVLLAHPQTGGVSNTFICLTEEEQAAASQGELSVEAMKRKEEDFVGQDYKMVYTKNFFIGLDIEKKPKGAQGGGRILNLFYPSKRFCAACQQWDKYDEQEMSVILRPARRSDLPFYVFPDGVPKPKKKGKREKVATESGTEEQPDGSGQGPAKRSKSAGGMEETDEAAPAAAADCLSGAGNTGEEPTPNNAGPSPVEVQTPTGLDHAASPSKVAQASFTSTANGAAEATNDGGKAVLNGA